MCVAFESISVVGESRGGGASWGEARIIARGVQASFGLLKALGYQIYPASKQRLARLPVPVLTAILWGLSRVRNFRELLATGKIECQNLVDDMLAAAAQSRVPIDLPRIRAMKP